jgi:hypothetical protein
MKLMCPNEDQVDQHGQDEVVEADRQPCQPEADQRQDDQADDQPGGGPPHLGDLAGARGGGLGRGGGHSSVHG